MRDLPMSVRRSGRIVALAASLAAACGGGRTTPPPVEGRTPNPDGGAETLAARRAKQIEGARGIRAFHDFQFADKLPESGITFVNRIVEDAGKHYKAVHYDHGTGLAVADVDGDGLPDIYFVNQVGGNELWKNAGGGRFTPITKEAGVALAGRISVAAAFADVDNDGDQDLFVTTVRGGNVLFENEGHGRFRDITKEAGLDLVAHSSGAVYFENDGGRRFVDKTAERFPRTPWGAMGIKFLDFDNDGLPDLFITDMHSDMFDMLAPDHEKDKAPVHPPEQILGGAADTFVFGNAFFHNRGGGRFEEISDRIGAENYWPWGPSAGDVNADGWDDVFIASSMNYPHRYGVNSLLLNDRGERFADAEFVLGIEPRRGGRTHTPWFDLDCLQEGVGQDLCRGQSGTIRVMAPLGSRSAAIFDLDGDGDLDIVTNDFNSAPQVLVSDLAQRRAIHWIGVSLAGTASNRNGLGAIVRVRTGGRVYTKFNDGKSGYLSQSVVPLYFGLGDATSIDRIDIDWPSGKKQTETVAGINRLLRI